MANPGIVTVKIDEDAIKERVREYLAQAWDEGWEHAEQCSGCDIYKANPYRP